MQKNKKKPK